MIKVAWIVVRRPPLWLPALKAAWRVRSGPGLLPSRTWWEWRLQTAYGKEAQPRPEDVAAWLEWCAAYEQARR